MNQGMLAPLFALFIWMLALLAENKFAYFYEDKDPVSCSVGQVGWRRLLIRRNIELKYVGLGLLWSGFSIATVLFDGQLEIRSIAFYIVGLVGLITYVDSRMWPFLRK